MNNAVKTQIRMGADLHQQIMRICDKTGDSMNGTMLHLIHLGLKVYDSELRIASTVETVPCSDS